MTNLSPFMCVRIFMTRTMQRRIIPILADRLIAESHRKRNGASMPDSFPNLEKQDIIRSYPIRQTRIMEHPDWLIVSKAIVGNPCLENLIISHGQHRYENRTKYSVYSLIITIASGRTIIRASDKQLRLQTETCRKFVEMWLHAKRCNRNYLPPTGPVIIVEQHLRRWVKKLICCEVWRRRPTLCMTRLKIREKNSTTTWSKSLPEQPMTS